MGRAYVSSSVMGSSESASIGGGVGEDGEEKENGLSEDREVGSGAEDEDGRDSDLGLVAGTVRE
jgi:hypothetical protein